MGGIPAGIEPCPSFIDSATRWRADSRSVVFISRFSFPFGICLPIPTVHLVRLLGAVTTCGLWGDLVGWPLFILLPRAEKKDIYLKLIHHQHVLSFFFFYFNIQMALIARVAEFFFCQKSVIILNHRTRWSSSGLRFAAAKEWPTQESHVECQSIPPPLQSDGNLLLLLQREAITTSNYAKCGGCRQCGVKMTLSLKGGPPRPVSLVSFFSRQLPL